VAVVLFLIKEPKSSKQIGFFAARRLCAQMKQNLGWVTAAPLFAPTILRFSNSNARPCNRTALHCFASFFPKLIC